MATKSAATWDDSVGSVISESKHGNREKERLQGSIQHACSFARGPQEAAVLDVRALQGFAATLQNNWSAKTLINILETILAVPCVHSAFLLPRLVRWVFRSCNRVKCRRAGLGNRIGLRLPGKSQDFLKAHGRPHKPCRPTSLACALEQAVFVPPRQSWRSCMGC